MRIVGDDSQIYTFATMFRQLRSVAFRLIQEGIQFGDRVALIGENHPNWAIAYLGIISRGAVCVPLDPHGEIETITNFLDNSEAKLAFISHDQRERFTAIEEALGRRIPAVVWGTDGTALDNGFQNFDDWTCFDPSGAVEPLPSPSGDDNALLIYTSGTTGTPKGVPLTHGNIVAELNGINEVLKLSSLEKILSLLPLYHAYLQIVNLWVATTYGCEVGYLKELSPAELSSAMKSFKPTILTTVPRLWYIFHKKIFDAAAAKPAGVRLLFNTMLALNGSLRDTVGIDLGRKFFSQVHESFGGCLRLAVSAGSRFDEKVATDFHKLGFTIIQGYGLTETSGAATATFETDNQVGSVGKPLKGSEIKISEPDKDGIGEVLIRGGIVFSGYYRNPEATAEAFTEDGWFRSGDLGKLDPEGHLYIVGRAKDVIVLPSGKNVHPEDIEVHYLKSPLVEELAILGVRDENEMRAGAEKLVAVVVPDFEYLKLENVANSKEAIRHDLDNLGRHLPEYQRVRDYIIRIEPLPRTATRKIKRFQLKTEIENGVVDAGSIEQRSLQLTGEDERILSTKAAVAVVAALKQYAKETPAIHPSMNLEIDLGLDSLARAESFAALEHAFDTEFAAEEAARALTIKDVIDLVEAHSAGGSNEIRSTELNWTKIITEADDKLPEIQGVLRDRYVFTAFAFTVYRLFNYFCRLFMKLDVQGIDELRKMKRPFLICPNHQSYLDPFVISSNYSFEFFRNTFHVGASEFFQNAFMRWLSRLLNVVPVDPDTQLMKAMKAGAVGLKHGRILNIYPEGERAFDGRLHEFKKGAAILATELGIPILPVAIDGLHKVWPRHSWRIRPAKVKVRFGRPFFAADVIAASADDEGVGSANDAKYQAVTDHLKHSIASMIEEMRGKGS
jgi:long-chain acyl-CoA synthetase